MNGSREKIFIGNPYVEKEWGFAGDIMEGIFTLMNQDAVFEAVIGTGIAHSILDFLICCCQIAGIKLEQYVEFGKDFVPEYARLVSNPVTIHGLGWHHVTDLKGLSELMLHN